MARNYYSEINLHVVWHTKESLPLLTPEVEQLVHRHLRRKCVDAAGVYVHEIGGTENHVHLCLTVAPTVLVSELVGQLKGASSHEANQRVGGRRKVLNWQAGYGVVSFGTKDLEWVKAYVRNQREHHKRGRAQDRLERVTDEEVAARQAMPRRPTRSDRGEPTTANRPARTRRTQTVRGASLARKRSNRPRSRRGSRSSLIRKGR
jgi:putative transposase